MPPIYLDTNATTPLDPRVADAMRPHLSEIFGNPSSTHAFGAAARAAVDRARDQVAALLGAAPDEIVFTSGGSEANNHAIKGAAWARRDRGRHLVISAVEHPAVAEVAAWLEQEGWRVSRLPVDGKGRVDPADLAGVIDHTTVLVSVMHANNEVGTLQPIRELAAIAHDHGAWLHTDAAQSVGKVPVNVHDLGVDLLTVAGHKLYAPKGVGALFVRRGLTLTPLIHGAGHEGGRRAGTENVLAEVGLGEACALAASALPATTARLAALRDRLQAGLLAACPQAVVHGDPAHRLPNTLSIAFPDKRADVILAAVSDRVAASAGSACHEGCDVISGVLAAMSVPPALARGTLRLSVGRFTTEAEIDAAVATLAGALG